MSNLMSNDKALQIFLVDATCCVCLTLFYRQACI